MIKIVVRHHSHPRQQHHHLPQDAPELTIEHNRSNRKRLNQEAGATSSSSSSSKRQSRNNQTSSSVEIKYSKMSTFSAAPKAALRSAHKSAPVAVSRQKAPAGVKSVQQLPRGSLSSCSSSSPDLSGNEEAEYFRSYHPQDRRTFNYSLSVFDESSADELDEQPLDLNNNQETVRAGPAAVAPVARARATQIHHSRSISLMVNPDFDSSSAEDSEPAAQAAVAGSAKYKRGRNRFHYRQASHCPVVQREFKEADFLGLKQLREELEASKLTEAESARLREIGFFLRQISDEFALDRRLTI